MSCITNLVLAPSTKEAVFVQKNKQYELIHINLQTDQLTQWATTEHSIHQVAWSPNGQQLAFLQSLQGDKQLYIMDAQNSPKQVVLIDGGVRQFYWSPCGQKIWLTSEQSGAIFYLDKETASLHPFLMIDCQLLAVSNSGQQMVIFDEQEKALYIVDTTTRQRTCIDSIRHQIEQAVFSFSDQYIAYIGQETLLGESTYPAVYVYDTELNITQNITEMLDAPVGNCINEQQGVQKIAWTETDAFYFQLSVMGDVRLYYADLYGSILPASPENQCVICYSVAPSGNWALITVTTARAEQLQLFDITTGQALILVSLQY